MTTPDTSVAAKAAPSSSRQSWGTVAKRQARRQFEFEVRGGEHNGKTIPPHSMTVLMDKSFSAITRGGDIPGEPEPYRHLRFSKPGTGIWRFELVTWPGHLAISGDIGKFMFARDHDMLGFFLRNRGGADDASINASYWAEKVIAGNPRTDYVSQRFVDLVLAAVEDVRFDYEPEEFARLRAAVIEEVLCGDETGNSGPDYADCALDDARHFRWHPSGDVADQYGSDAFILEPDDFVEAGLGGYDHHFLLALYAIAYGARTYAKTYPDRILGR